jgi:cellulose synthase/poly-beta-1,6-N-acetylglucosamine synthase-like glycosyltransferase
VLAVLVGVRWSVMFVMSYAAILRTSGNTPMSRDTRLPYVSILAPAYCEAACVRDAMNSLVNLDYPAYEIIFVDDGSPDETYSLALPFAGTHRSKFGICDVRVFTKPNQGKWAAHNFGLRHAVGSLILCIDADSRIDLDALRRMVPHMRDCRVGAVAGQIRVRNRQTALTLLQSFEYIFANGALRMAQGLTGTVMIVPGPIGLFRREALDHVEQENTRFEPTREPGTEGPFSHLTFAEDFHLSLSMLALGWRVEYEPHAVAHTKAPSTIATLLSQRYRWNRGTMQVLQWYLRRFFRGGKAPLKLHVWILADFLLDYFFFALVNTLLLGCLALYFVTGGSLGQLGAWAACACLVNLMSLSLYAVAHRDCMLLSLLAPVFDLYQSILLKGAWLIAVVDEVRGAGMRW